MRTKTLCVNDVTNIENLFWAWEKTKAFLQTGDIWYDEFELAKFELCLNDNLMSIKKNIDSGKYYCKPIIPIAYPKGLDDKGNKRIRQYFGISLYDQVTWMAVLNIIGSHLDYIMPFWSYGNRLFMSVWYENKNNNEKELKFGWYRNTSRYTYRKWNHSWPMYRHHISLVAKIMSNNKTIDLDEKEKAILEMNDLYPNHLKVKYLNSEYWHTNKTTGEVYWASIDLKKFYPSISMENVIKNIEKHVKVEASFVQLIKNISEFRIDTSGWSLSDLKSESKFNLEGVNVYNQIPTGLFCAGFLANIGMLEIDRVIQDKLNKNKKVAHFRFVDDHTFLANDFNVLLAWLKEYEEILLSNNHTLTLNTDKTEPKELRKYLTEYSNNISEIKKAENKTSKLYEEAKKASFLDPYFQEPLMTMTLNKISQIAQTKYNLLREEELNVLLADVEHLLITDFPDHEIKRDTRISFSARVLSILAPLKKHNHSNIITYEIEKIEHRIRMQITEKEQKVYNKKSDNYKYYHDLLHVLSEKIKDIDFELQKEYKLVEDAEIRRQIGYEKLFIKAIKECPEKLKLWIRTLEYSQKVGNHSIVIKLLYLLNKLNVITEDSKELIVAIIFHNVAKHIVLSYKCLDTKKFPEARVNKSYKYLIGLFKDEVFVDYLSELNKKPNKIYLKASLEYLNTVIGQTAFLLSINGNKAYSIEGSIYNNLRERLGLDNWLGTKDLKGIGSELPIKIWISIKNYDDINHVKPNIFWIKGIKQCPFGNRNIKTLLSLYPNNITHQILLKIDSNWTKKFKDKGWYYDLQNNNHDKSQSPKKLSLIPTMKINNTKTINLYDFIEMGKGLVNTSKISVDNVFDPRWSEWTALTIMEQIVVEHINRQSIKLTLSMKNINILMVSALDSGNVHPSNYLIDRNWMLKNKEYWIPNWEEWYSIVEKYPIKFNTKKARITDARYTPMFYDVAGVNNVESSTVFGLGLILTGLLGKDFTFPALFNQDNYIKNKANAIISKLSEIPVSTYTLEILRGIFSKRWREVAFIDVNSVSTNILSADTRYDPINISTLDILLKHLKSAKNELKKYHISVLDHKARSLVPISLISITQFNNPYLRESNEINTN